MTDLREHNIEEDFFGARLDRWISHFFSKISHNNLEKLLRKGIIRVNGKKVKSNFRLNETRDQAIVSLKFLILLTIISLSIDKETALRINLSVNGSD